MDVVSDVLRAIPLSGLVTFHTELTAPWGLAVPPAPALTKLFDLGTRRLIPFHAVAKGHCLSLLDGSDDCLEEGDVVMYPRGDAHVLASDAQAVPTPVGGLLPLPPPDVLLGPRHGGGAGITEPDRDPLHIG